MPTAAAAVGERLSCENVLGVANGYGLLRMVVVLDFESAFVEHQESTIAGFVAMRALDFVASLVGELSGSSDWSASLVGELGRRALDTGT